MTVRVIITGKASTSTVGIVEVERLEHLRELLPSDTIDASPRLLLFGRSGFTREVVRAAAARSDLELIDLDRLYGGA